MIVIVSLALLATIVFWLTLKPYVSTYLFPFKNSRTLFFPLRYYPRFFRRSSKLYGDPQKSLKQIMMNNPSIQTLVSSIGSKRLVCFVSSHLVKLSLNEYSDRFVKQNILLFIENLFIKGLVFSDGQQWKKHRKFTSELFTFEALKQRVPLIIEIVNSNIQALKDDSKFIEKNGLYSFTEKISGEVVVATFFGSSFKSTTISGVPITKALTILVNEIQQYSLRPLMLILRGLLGKHVYKFLPPHGRQIERQVNVVKQVVMQTMEERHQQLRTAKSEKKYSSFYDSSINFVDHYLDGFDREQADVSIPPQLKISKEDILHQFMTFFVAGTDTTGVFLGLCIAMLGMHPQYQALLWEEFTQIAGDQQITVDSVKQLKLLDAFLNECFRYHLPITNLFARRAKQDFHMGAFPISKNDMYITLIGAQMFNPEVFKDPTKFEPERWLRDNEMLKQDPYYFCPFSAGPRNCIGQHLALLETKIGLLLVLKEFEIIAKVDRLKFINKLLIRIENDKDVVELRRKVQ